VALSGAREAILLGWGGVLLVPEGVEGCEEKLRLNMPGMVLSLLGLRFQNGLRSPSLKYPAL